jgi:integrase
MHSEPNVRAPRTNRVKVPRTTGIYRRTTTKGETRYEYAYVDGSGRQRWGTTATLREAKRRREALRVKVANGEVIPSSKKTFAELAEEWYEAKVTSGRRPLRRRSAVYYRSALDLVLLPRFGRLRLAAIDAEAIARLTRDLEREGLHAIHEERPLRPLGASSIANYLKPLKGVLALAVRRRLIATNPFEVLTDDDRPAVEERSPAHEWSPEEVSALLRASERLAARRDARYDYSPLLRLAATLGLRIGEILGLKWIDLDKDVDGGEGVLHVRRQWLRTGEYGPPKTKAGTRDIPLPSGIRDELIALRLRSPWSQDDAPICSSLNGTPLGHRNVTRRGFEPARDLAGLPSSLRFHDLRHATASRLINAGLDPVAVAAVLGHEDATTTLKVYARQFDWRRTSAAVREALAT